MARSHYNNGDEVTFIENNCDGCSPSVINGLLCHESGCPDEWKDRSRDCAECGDTFFAENRFQRMCVSCENPEPFTDEDE